MLRFLPFNQVAVNDLKVVVGNVGEGRTAFHVTQRPNAGNIGLEPVIDLDRPVVPGRNTSVIEREVFRIGTPAGGHQKMRASDGQRTTSLLDRRDDLAIFLLHLRRLRLEQKLDAFRRQRPLQLGCDLGLFTWKNPFAILNNRNFAAEAAKHLAELKPNVAAAKNHEMFGHRRQLHDGFVGQVVDRVQPRNGWNDRPRSRVDEDALALQQTDRQL